MSTPSLLSLEMSMLVVDGRWVKLVDDSVCVVWIRALVIWLIVLHSTKRDSTISRAHTKLVSKVLSLPVGAVRSEGCQRSVP